MVSGPDRGIGGSIKVEPSHFEVEEIPLYPCAGEGGHVYLTVRREGMNTRDIATALQRTFGIREDEVGYAGLKDKTARATQTFSLALQSMDPAEAASKASALEFESGGKLTVLAATRHGNKLRTGHLLGNRFKIRLVAPVSGALEWAQATAMVLRQTGVPNFYGPQRFGMKGDNALRGYEILGGGGPRAPWLRRLLTSALKSAAFNEWLRRRMERGEGARLIEGDIAKKTDTGGIFDVTDAALEQPRFDAGEITYTGPIFGKKMREAGGRAGEWEAEIAHELHLTDDAMRRARMDGSRRRAHLRLDDLSIEPMEGGDLLFSFTLPKGSYATVVMREFMKTDVMVGGDDGE